MRTSVQPRRYPPALQYSGPGGGGRLGSGLNRRRKRSRALPLFFFLLPPVGFFGESQLLFHLELEIVGGLAELVHELADLASDLGQAPRSENHQGQHHQNERVGHSQACNFNV